MPNSQLHTAISNPRFSRYLIACGYKKQKALKLYRANIILSQKMYAVIGVFEVVLRNSIDRHFLNSKGNDWLANSVQIGGYLDVTLGCEDSFHSIQEAIHRLGIEYTHDRLIAKLSFGFWTYQFASKEFAASGSNLLDIFPNRPFGTKQKTVFQNLIKINDIRNRIAHYEPICFDKATGTISPNLVIKRHALITEMLTWLGCKHEKILYGIDGVNKGIQILNTI